MAEPVAEQAKSKNLRGKARSVVSGFVEFVQNYGVLPLAIGVVLGTAVNDLVKSIVDGIISPLIGLLTPTDSLASWEVTLSGSVFRFGAVIDGAIKFLSIAAVVYVTVRLILRREDLLAKK